MVLSSRFTLPLIIAIGAASAALGAPLVQHFPSAQALRRDVGIAPPEVPQEQGSELPSGASNMVTQGSDAHRLEVLFHNNMGEDSSSHDNKMRILRYDHGNSEKESVEGVIDIHDNKHFDLGSNGHRDIVLSVPISKRQESIEGIGRRAEDLTLEEWRKNAQAVTSIWKAHLASIRGLISSTEFDECNKLCTETEDELRKFIDPDAFEAWKKQREPLKKFDLSGCKACEMTRSGQRDRG